ncbi:hypothetical protein RZ882_005545 [Clostridioides difficile]|uniref:hypothetical protein n=2 Tax=Clostridioides difficile TaxID=1496 RepID=UPI0008A486C5|nr:hypothetical protein [Clostridioides difficile]OFU34584.1 hypothetical protein HMPREF3075_03510 [Clostridium sp. HMSC19B11]EGT4696357.1 hypothetical protein [Clostridioides difficile]EGT4914833.1 hypothetical protein [Clostridioides difficile]MBH7450484.1 hypothetical protein [Clostridioides difficile]MBH8116178.1 hypothetical protein [Clostridioides difficile]
MKRTKLLQRGNFFGDKNMVVDEFDEGYDNYDFINFFTGCCNYTFGLKNNNILYGCGDNSNFQLGLGEDNTTRKLFTKIPNISTNIKKVACGESHAVILTSDGELLVAGINTDGQMGLGLEKVGKTVSTFEKVLEIKGVKDIACGLQSTYLLYNDGTLYVAGNNLYGQLGLGTNGASANVNTFTKVDVDNVKAVFSYNKSAFIIKNDNKCYSTGFNNQGQLGLGDKNNRDLFSLVSINDVKTIACGSEHTVLMTYNNDIYGCGKEKCFGNALQSSLFTKIEEVNIKTIACGNGNTMLIDNKGILKVAGNNDIYQLGIANYSENIDNSFIDLKNIVAKNIFIGLSHSILIDSNNDSYCTGDNTYGQLGSFFDDMHVVEFKKMDNEKYSYSNYINLIKSEDKLTLLKEEMEIKDIELPLDIHSVRDVVFSPYCTLVILANGDVYGLGNNGYKGMGSDLPSQLNELTKLSISNVKSIVASKNISGGIFYIKNDDTCYYSGPNSNSIAGVLPSNSDVFKKISIDNVKKVVINTDLSNWFSLIVTNNKQIYTSGKSSTYVNGLSNISASQYTEISLSNVTDAYSSYNATFIVADEKKVYATGINTNYMLGVNVNNETYTTNLRLLSTWSYINPGGTSYSVISCANDITKINNIIIYEYVTIFCTNIGSFLTGYHGTRWIKPTDSNYKVQHQGISYAGCVENYVYNYYPTRCTQSSYSTNFAYLYYGESSSNLKNYNPDNLLISGGSSYIHQYGRNYLNNQSSNNIAASNINSGPITSDKAIFLYKALLYLSSNTLYGFGNISESAKELDVSDTQDGYNATNYKKVMKNIKNIFIPPYDLSRDKTRFAILTDKSLFICGYNSKGTHGISVNSSLNLNNKINYNKKNSSSEISSNIQEIYSHSKSTYLLTNNNMIYSVGLNDVGQLGVGDEINRKVFTKINIDNIKSINVNRFTDNSKHAFAIKNDNTCYAVGLNNSGQLGIGDNVNRNVFTKINVENVKYVAVYGNTSLLLTNDGLLYGAGNNGKGQLGLGDTTSRNIFTRIPINGVRDVYLCNDVSIIVKNDNTCYVCGFVNGYFGFTESSISTFTKINIENVKSVVTAGSEATFFITNDNVIYTTGKKERVFFSTETNDIKGIRVINNIINAKKIVVNGYTSAILTNDNKLFVGGLSGYGSIANNNNTNSVEDVKDVFVTANNTLYIDNNNNLISSGRDTYGISDEYYRDMSVPYYKVSIKKDVDTVFSSYNTIFIKDIYGKFYSSTGDNRYNHLGIHHRYDNDKNEALEGSLHSYFKTDDTSDKIVFNKKNEKLVMFNDKYIKTNNKYINYKNIFKDNFKYTSIILPFEVSDIDISKTHSLAVAKDGKLYGIGSNSYKEINQTLEDIELLTFTEVNISDVKKVACGDNYSYIIKTDNTLWSYGKNTEYQLGVGHNNDVRELQKVTGLPSVKDISIYNSMTLVLTNEGELYAQGYNTNGLFGLGESEKDKIITTFTKVLTNVKEIKSHNDDHILVIKNDNSLWITGKNKSMYKISISITDLYEFTKIPVPEHLNDILDIELSDDTIYMITKVDTSKASIEIVEKSISQVRVVVQDPNNVIEKLEMFINDELISTKTNLEINSIIFEIPQNKIVLGENKILIKASSPTGDLYSSMFIFKSETGLKVKKDSILMINNKVYSIINITENNTDLIVTLNEGLKDDMMENNPIYQLINKTKVQVKINKSDLFKDMKLVEIKKSDSSYQEIYELEEANIKSAQPKIIVEKGDKWTAIKRPSMIFRYDAENNEPQA